jgi:hypothetical protein
VQPRSASVVVFLRHEGMPANHQEIIVNTHHIRNATLLGLSFAACAGTLAWMRRRKAARPDVLPVRDAGPECMQNPPRSWDMTDEASDESFPASDPPGTY